MPYLATIDAAACAAHGDCEAIAPEIFAVENVAVIVGSGPDELVLQAARLCPSAAITVTDGESGRQVFP
jgi:ferredoxin